jgi:hypothetical protein
VAHFAWPLTKWRNYCVQHLYTCYEATPSPTILDTLFEAAEGTPRTKRIRCVEHQA